MGLSERAYAVYRKKRGLPGGTRWAVRKAVRDGRISKGPDRLIDPGRADREREGNTAEHKRHSEPSPSTYQEARAIREALNARLTKLEYDERIGDLVRAADVRKEAFEVGRTFRDRMLAVPGRVAALVAAEADVRKVEAKLADEIRRALEEVGVE